MTHLERFMRKVKQEGDCLIWQASFRTDGYGAVRINKVLYGAHRASYMLHKGEIPKGMVVRHTCDNKACVNPEHLILGTQADNLNDMVLRGRSRTNEKHHNVKLTDSQVEAIRKDERPNVRIAEDYNVTASHIGRIKKKEKR